MKTLARISALAAVCSALGLTGCIGNNEKDNDMDTLNLTAEWDKVFPQSEKTEHTKITFRNRYGITLDEMSAKELREYGKELGLTFRVGMTKAEMREAIVAAEDAAEPEDDEAPPVFDAAEAVM